MKMWQLDTNWLGFISTNKFKSTYCFLINRSASPLCCWEEMRVIRCGRTSDRGYIPSKFPRGNWSTIVCWLVWSKSLCQVRSYGHTYLADRNGIRDSVDKKHQGSFGECTQSQSRGLGDYCYTHCDADESSFHSVETGDYYSIADESRSVDRILHSYSDV